MFGGRGKGTIKTVLFIKWEKEGVRTVLVVTLLGRISILQLIKAWNNNLLDSLRSKRVKAHGLLPLLQELVPTPYLPTLEDQKSRHFHH